MFMQRMFQKYNSGENQEGKAASESMELGLDFHRRTQGFASLREISADPNYDGQTLTGRAASAIVISGARLVLRDELLPGLSLLPGHPSPEALLNIQTLPSL